jgi:hypothetical protein
VSCQYWLAAGLDILHHGLPLVQRSRHAQLHLTLALLITLEASSLIKALCLECADCEVRQTCLDCIEYTVVVHAGLTRLPEASADTPSSAVQ